MGRGGLRLADLAYRTTVAKMKWVQRLAVNMGGFSGRFLSFLSGKTHIQCLIHGKLGALPERLKDSLFYSETFRLWLDLHGFPPASEEGIRGEILWYNKRITMDSLPFCWSDWVGKGIWRVEDIVAPREGRFLSHKELNNKYGT